MHRSKAKIHGMPQSLVEIIIGSVSEQGSPQDQGQLRIRVLISGSWLRTVLYGPYILLQRTVYFKRKDLYFQFWVDIFSQDCIFYLWPLEPISWISLSMKLLVFNLVIMIETIVGQFNSRKQKWRSWDWMEALTSFDKTSEEVFSH